MRLPTTAQNLLFTQLNVASINICHKPPAQNCFFLCVKRQTSTSVPLENAYVRTRASYNDALRKPSKHAPSFFFSHLWKNFSVDPRTILNPVVAVISIDSSFFSSFFYLVQKNCCVADLCTNLRGFSFFFGGGHFIVGRL